MKFNSFQITKEKYLLIKFLGVIFFKISVVKTFNSVIKKRMLLILVLFIASLILNCENMDRFVRPDLPEKLCSIGIIDADDTVRYISFEKSFQSEYPEEINDSLRGLTFSISSSANQIFSYHSDSTIKNFLAYRLPNDVEFITNEKYFLSAHENSTSDISAEAIVPPPPPALNLISMSKEVTPIKTPLPCSVFDSIKNAVLTISFSPNDNPGQFYAILLKGSGIILSSSLPPDITSYLDFSVRESNTPGFFSTIYGLSMYHYKCTNYSISLDESHVSAYFIDGDKIPGNSCNLVLSVQFQDVYSIIDILRSVQIRLLSISKELYIFEKSLYTYSQIKDDPFSEPVYLNGNIIKGNGVFSICRSSNLTYTIPSYPGF